MRRLRAGGRPQLRVALLLLALAILAVPARADWLQPDASMKEAQWRLSTAVRDTAGQALNPSRLDTLGVALLRLGRSVEARAVLERVLALSPNDPSALAGLGKLALFADRLAAADSLLTAAVATGVATEAVRDLYAAKLRRGDVRGAIALAPQVNEQGRVPLLERIAERGVYRITAGPELVRHPFSRAYPLPLVRVKLNGQAVLMAIDTGVRDVLVDQSAARRCGVEMIPGQSPVFWNGTRLAVRNAMIQRLEIGGLKLEALPAGTTSLRKWTIQVNPAGETVVGILGLGFLRQFTPTLDYKQHVLELRRGAEHPTYDEGAMRVPFEMWGESEMTVYGSLAGGRLMALVVQSGLPECGVAAPADVFEEIGVRSGAMARAVKGAGVWLQGRPWVGVVVPTVTVGPVIQNKVPGWAGALDSGELWRHGVRRDAILSNDFFKGMRVTLDWSAHALVIEDRE